MTRVVCTSDIQLGAGASYLPEKIGPGSRLDDHQRAWTDVARLAIDQGADAVIVAGDAFDEKRPGPSALLAFQRGLSMLRDARIRTVVIAGNHEVRAPEEPTALELFEDELVSVWRAPGWDWLTRDVAYAVLPWTTIGGLAALRGGGDRDLLHAEAGELLAQVAAGLREEIRQSGAKHAILVAHWAVSGAAMPTGISSDDLSEVVIPAHLLAEQEWDAIVLGHIHRPQAVGSDGVRFYCGSPLPCDFGEAGYVHGAWLLELDASRDDDYAGGTVLDFQSWDPARGVTHRARFLPIESRPFVTLDVGRLDEAPARLDDAIVRVVGKITRAESDICDRDFVAATLMANGAATVRVEVDVEHATRARAEHVTRDIDPVTALDAWLTAAKPDADIAQVTALHRAYVEQETAA